MTVDVRSLATPDPRHRVEKAVWRQALALLGEAKDAALAHNGFASPHITYFSDTPISAHRLLDFGNIRWRPLTDPYSPDETPNHIAAALVGDGLPAARRLDALERVCSSVRPSGTL